MPQISAVIITFNEEQNIERCLQSLSNIADEIVIVDSFSTDNTSAICAKYNVQFVQKQWQGYAEQKNLANSLTKHSWILSIDADEQLSDTLKQSILDAKKKLNDNTIVYSMNRCTNYCGKWIKHCGWYPDTKIRLFNKQNTTWNNMLIHEELNFITKPSISHLKGDILHYSYYTIQAHIKQANKFTDLTARFAFDNNKKSSVLNVFFNPKWKFFQSFILQLGFLDGYHGYIVCKVSAFATYLKYTKLHQLWIEKTNNDN